MRIVLSQLKLDTTVFSIFDSRPTPKCMELYECQPTVEGGITQMFTTNSRKRTAYVG